MLGMRAGNAYVSSWAGNAYVSSWAGNAYVGNEGWECR